MPGVILRILSRALSYSLFGALVTCVSMVALSGLASAQTETILHTFEGPDGSFVPSGLVFDAAGNLYGTTEEGGAFGKGTIFELSPSLGGTWNFTLLYSFTGGADGNGPYGTLTIDSAGNLYGCAAGGANELGTAFEFARSSEGQWTLTVLYSFGAYPGDSTGPAGLIFGPDGNLYGATYSGGTGTCVGGCGSVFELATSASGQWNETVLYSFAGRTDGDHANASLVFDGQGNLYGTTSQGGKLGYCLNDGCGTVFELMPAQGGLWTEQIIHWFNGREGGFPEAGLTIDSSGNLYGTTQVGGLVPCDTGLGGCGLVFRLKPLGSGGWFYTVLHKFGGGSSGDGANPVAGLVFDKGSLYGTTFAGGSTSPGFGAVFQLEERGGQFVETVYGNFGGSNGEHPTAPVVLDSQGRVYGTTTNSVPGDGIVFELMPKPPPEGRK
jgi:uncharacterized repeat protein (TIGR03803 family)